MRKIELFSLIAVLMIGLGACKSDTKSKTDMTEVNKDKKYKLIPFSSSKDYPGATISNMTYEGGKFSFDVSGGGYELGNQTPDADNKMCANSAKGQHIHLIVDKLPYSAQYVSSFEHSVADGKHNLLAFLSRSYHESIKSESAHIAKAVTVVDGSITATEEISEPTLFYSRPKGTYVGDDTKRVMLDFYPINVDLSEFRIKVQINGEVTLLDSWEPFYIEGLPYGQNSIGVAIVYPDGSPVPGKQTAVLQTITLEENPQPGN